MHLWLRCIPLNLSNFVTVSFLLLYCQAGTGTIDPEHVKEMTKQAIDLGCDASLVVTPYYVKPPQRGLIKHFTDAADLGLPVVMMVYVHNTSVVEFNK